MPDTTWFADAKFGLFVHWGVYAVRGRGEWAMYRERIPKEEYARYREIFNPDRFDADEWVAQAKRAGMRYMVVTSKHHDGFCMFDSAHTDWKITNTPFGRDVIGELADACRRGGIRFGIYYSVWDLWHPGLDGGMGTDLGPDGEPVDRRDAGWAPSEEGVDYMHAQVEELLSDYGAVDVFWFDVRRASCEAYRGRELMRRIRDLQPDILVNDRLVGDDTETPADLRTPENAIPAEGLVDASGNPVLWESCMCYNKNWGYVHDDRSYKGPDRAVRELVEIVGKGGNCLLNVGPNARGEFPKPWYPEMFESVGDWLDRNGESIYGTRAAGWNSARHFRWKTVATRKGDTYYLHILDYPSESLIAVPPVEGKRFRSFRLLDDGMDVPVRNEHYLNLRSGFVTLELPRFPAPGPVTTIVVETEDA